MNFNLPINISSGLVSKRSIESSMMLQFTENRKLGRASENFRAEMTIDGADDNQEAKLGPDSASTEIQVDWAEEQGYDQTFLQSISIDDVDETPNLTLRSFAKDGQGFVEVSNPSPYNDEDKATVEIPLGPISDGEISKLEGKNLSSVSIGRKNGGMAIELKDADEQQTEWLLLDGELKSKEDLRPKVGEALPDWAKADLQHYGDAGSFAADSSTKPFKLEPGQLEEMTEIFEMTEEDENPDLDGACGMPGIIAFPTGNVVQFGEKDGTDWMAVGNGVETKHGWIKNIQYYEKDENGFRSYSFEEDGDRTHTSVVDVKADGSATITKRGNSPIEEFFRSRDKD